LTDCRRNDEDQSEGKRARHCESLKEHYQGQGFGSIAKKPLLETKPGKADIGYH